MADTSKMKLMSNLNLNDNSFIVKDTTRITFPDNPIEGIECLVNGINYIYTEQAEEFCWIPTSVIRKQHKFAQLEANKTWTINHNLNTDISDLDIIAYNPLREVIYGTIVQIDKNSFNITFDSTVSGKVSVFQTGGDGGTTGKDGLSAYELYVEIVPEGETPLTIEEWLESLKGKDGANGADGKSAYELYVDNLPEGETPLTLEQWLESLKATEFNLSSELLNKINSKKVASISGDSVTKNINITYTDNSSEVINLQELVTDIHVDGASFNPETKVITLTKSGTEEPITIDLSLLVAEAGNIDFSEVYEALENKQDKLISGTNIKTINGQDILGEGDIEIVPEVTVEQNIDASTLTPEQMDYLRDKQMKFGTWRCESIPSTSYTTPSQKLPFFRTKRSGILNSQNETDFLFKKGVYYDIDVSYSITTNGAILAIALVDSNNNIIGDCYRTSRINTVGTNNEIDGSRMFTVAQDVVGSFKITYLSTSPLTVTLSEIKVNITEIDSFDVSLKNFTINGKSFDENNNIDLEGLSNLSSPKLNVEVLTERRHPISGKPIYVKTIDFGSLPNTSIKNVPHTITNYDYICVNLEYSYIYIPNIAGFSFAGALSVWNNKIDDVGTYIDGSYLSMATGKNRTNMKAYITVEYTKTTDTTQSPVRLVGGKDLFDTMKDRGFEGSYEDFLIEMKGPEGNSVIDSVMLKLESSIEVTVGAGGDYPTINAALEFLSKNYYPVYKLHGVTATIRLLAGFVMQEQVFVRGLDLGWITIVGDDATTLVDNTSLVMDFSSSDYGVAAMPLFGISKGGYGPIINQRFTFDVLKPTGNKHGLMTIGAGSSAEILSGKGFIGAGNCGVYADLGSTILANGAILNASRVSGAYAAGNSSIVANDAYVNDCDANGIYAVNNSTITANNVNANNVGSRAIFANSNSRIVANSASAINSGNNAVSAVNCSVIMAGSVNATGCKFDGVYAAQNSEVYILGGTVNNFTRYGVVADFFSKINATNVIMQNQTVGYFRVAIYNGSTILAKGINVTGGTTAVLSQAANALTANGIIYQ